MSTRSDFIKGLTVKSLKWYWEAADKVYKTIDPIYKKIADVRPMSEMKGAFWPTTSALGITQLYERNENETIQSVAAVEGYPIYIKKRSFDVMTPVSFELNRDMDHVTEFMRDLIKSSIPQAVVTTKEKLLASIINNGGITTGHASFNNDIPSLLTTGYTNYVYDGVCLFALAGNERTAKNGSTYSNALASLLTFDNLSTAHNLLTGTNAKMENGEPFDNTQNKLLVVPTALQLTADRLINSTLIPGNNNNDTNPLSGAYDVVVNPYMTTATSWMLCRKGAGIVMFVEDDPVIDYWEVKETKQLRASIHIDLAIGIVNWRPIVGSNFATS
jgi:hypothetical protein